MTEDKRNLKKGKTKLSNLKNIMEIQRNWLSLVEIHRKKTKYESEILIELSQINLPIDFTSVCERIEQVE